MPKESTTDINELLKQSEEINSKVFIKGDYIVVNGGYEYDIPLSQASNPEDILARLLHLFGKTWMTTQMAERFIALACKHHGIELRH